MLEAGTMVGIMAMAKYLLLTSILGAPFTVYFYGEFSSAPHKAQTFTGNNTTPLHQNQNITNEGPGHPIWGHKSDRATSGPMGDRVGALFTWEDSEPSQINSRIGISFISVEKARSYILNEIPSWELDDTVVSAVQEWNDNVFSKIRVPLGETANTTHVRLLYSSLYFMHLMPSDRTGENPLWVSEEPYWDDFYTLCKQKYSLSFFFSTDFTEGDIFRCTVSFYHIFQPVYYESMVRGLIDIWR